VGLAAVLAGVVAGAETIVVVDLHAERRELAVEFGATHVVDGANDDVVRQVRKLTNGGADYAIDATGVPRVAESAITATRLGGACALAGVLTGPLTLKPMALLGKSVVGVLEGDSVPGEFIPALIDLWSAGRLPIERLIEQFPLSAINDAEEASLSGRVVKPVLIPD
jgi:aryl-alcohol dehydrogenase